MLKALGASSGPVGSAAGLSKTWEVNIAVLEAFAKVLK
jgi:hypothetical protein